LQDGQSKCGGFAAPRWSAGKEIVAGKSRRNAQALNGCGGRVPEVFDCAKQLSTKC